MFKSLSYKFANLLVKNEVIENEDFEIYRYGFETLIYFIVNICITLFIGIVFKRFIHTIIFLSCYCTLRQFTGGYHARSYVECTLTFVVIYLITIFIDNSIDIDKYKYLLILIMIFSICIIYKFSPLEHRNKPLSENEKKQYKKVVIKVTIFISSMIMISLVYSIFEEFIIYSLFSILWIAILLIIGVRCKYNNTY